MSVPATAQEIKVEHDADDSTCCCASETCSEITVGDLTIRVTDGGNHKKSPEPVRRLADEIAAWLVSR